MRKNNCKQDKHNRSHFLPPFMFTKESDYCSSRSILCSGMNKW